MRISRIKITLLFINTLVRLCIEYPERQWIGEDEISENYPVPAGKSYNEANNYYRDKWKRHISTIQRIALDHDYQAIIEEQTEKIRKKTPGTHLG